MPSFNRNSPLLLSVLSGLLLIAAWPTYGFAPLLFIAFVPLLIIETDKGSNTFKVFKFSYLAFIIWNTGTTWWIYKSTLFGCIGAIVCNALFMSLIFVLFHRTKAVLGKASGYISLVVYWIGFEYLHLNWDLSWPWLTLGNGFSVFTKLIQWYEFTGVLGGSLWILGMNILVFKFIEKRKEKESARSIVIALSLVLFVPIIYSFIRYYTYTEEKDPVSVTVTQPNIDPYNEKFGQMPSSEQLRRLLSLAAPLTDSSTDYIVGPETALPDGLWEDNINSYETIQTLKEFNKHYPNLRSVVGISSNKLFKKDEPLSETARKFRGEEGYYDSYNSAIQIGNKDSLQIYHKSKLVMGVEMIPFPFIFKHIEAFVIDLGGATGSLGTQPDREVFSNSIDESKVAPVICYESIYGDYVTGYVRNGANLIFIITNDGWWDETQGYQQHLSYARLRAIENRRSIARSANTGTSCFINQRGDVSQATNWWEPAAIKESINMNSDMTIYAKFGDYVGKICACLSVLLLSLFVYSYFRQKSLNHL